ncbi:hypothetical protein [Peribacillus frigoritolerans]|uniref:Uncharacterized protein n=1 Tax=Peribacillus castrilensis TaxID=2897690 RepID=A0AAW9NK54_9BACI|nr:hypothetical protein [Peribacillus castrilensis]
MKLQILSVQEIAELRQIYGNIDFDDDDNRVNEVFTTGVLDRFDRILNEEEAFKLLTNRYQDSKDEVRYVECFKKIFEWTGKSDVIVRNDLYNDNIRTYKKEMTQEQYRYLLLIKQSIKGEFIQTNDIKVLVFLFKLALQTYTTPDFFFPSINSVILGNHDMSLPVFCKSEDTIRKLETIVNQSGLYIRNIETKIQF